MVFNRRWTKIGVGVSAGVTSVFGFFLILVSVFGFDITSIDMVCGEICLVPINITNPTRYNVDIYNPEPIDLFFDGEIREHYLFRKDGRCKGGSACAAPNGVSLRGWNFIDFTNETKVRKDVKYAYRFRAYNTHEFLMWVNKSASDTLKWTIKLDGGFIVGNGELDPIIYGVLLRPGDGSVGGDWSHANMTVPVEDVSCNWGVCRHEAVVGNKLNVSVFVFVEYRFDEGDISRAYVNRWNPRLDVLDLNRTCNFSVSVKGDVLDCFEYNVGNSSNDSRWTQDCDSLSKDNKTCFWQEVRTPYPWQKVDTVNFSKNGKVSYYNPEGFSLSAGLIGKQQIAYTHVLSSGKNDIIVHISLTNDSSCVITDSCLYSYVVDPTWSIGSAFDTGLWAYYKQDEVSGNAFDSFSNGHNLSETGTVPANDTVLSGDFNGARGFHSDSNFHDKSTGDFSVVSNITFSAWFKKSTASCGTFVVPVSTAIDPTNDEIITIYYHDGQWKFWGGDGAAGCNAALTQALVDGRIYHFVGRMWANKTLDIFINGTQGTSCTHTTADLVSDTFKIGRWAIDAGRSNTCLIVDEVGVWNESSLSDSLISDLFNGGAGLVFHPAPDSTPPTIEITSPANQTNTSNAIFVFTVNTTDETAATMDVDIVCNGTVKASNASVVNNTLTNITATLGEGLNFCWATSSDGTNTNTSANFTYRLDQSEPVISNFAFFALNSTGGVIGNVSSFNTSNFQTIEFMRFNFTLTDELGFDANITVFFVNNGTDACSLGNNQSSVCTAWPSFIEFKDGTITSTFDAVNANLGDRVNCSFVGNSTERVYTCDIDQHYINGYRHYPLNFSDVKIQNGSTERIQNGTIWKIELNESIVPSDGDNYRIDFRLNSSQSTPNDNILVFLGNTSDCVGNVQACANASLVASKAVSDLTENGTRFRALFTANLTSVLNDVKFIFVTSDANVGFYSMKTFKIIGSGSSIASISNDNGLNYTNLSDGYEADMNIDWLQNGSGNNVTQFVVKIKSNDTLGNIGNSSSQVMTWLFGPLNTNPIVNIISPGINESVLINIVVNVSASDPEGNTFLLNFTLSNSSNTTIIGDSLDGSTTSITFNASNFTAAFYNLTVEACENNTAELLCGNDTHTIFVVNETFSVVVGVGVDPVVYAPNWSLINWSSTINISTGNFSWQMTQSNISVFNLTSFVFNVTNTRFALVEVGLLQNNTQEWYDWFCFGINITTSNTPLFNLSIGQGQLFNCSLDLKNISIVQVNWSVTIDRADWSFDYTFNNLEVV